MNDDATTAFGFNSLSENIWSNIMVYLFTAKDFSRLPCVNKSLFSNDVLMKFIKYQVHNNVKYQNLMIPIFPIAPSRCLVFMNQMSYRKLSPKSVPFVDKTKCDNGMYCVNKNKLLASKVCSKCKQVSYCSKKCQIHDWKATHSRECESYNENLLNNVIYKPRPISTVSIYRKNNNKETLQDFEKLYKNMKCTVELYDKYKGYSGLSVFFGSCQYERYDADFYNLLSCSNVKRVLNKDFMWFDENLLSGISTPTEASLIVQKAINERYDSSKYNLTTYVPIDSLLDDMHNFSLWGAIPVVFEACFGKTKVYKNLENACFNEYFECLDFEAHIGKLCFLLFQYGFVKDFTSFCHFST